MASESDRTALPFEPKGRAKAGTSSSVGKSGGSQSKRGAARQVESAKKKRRSAKAVTSEGTEVSAAARAKAEKIGLKSKKDRRIAQPAESKRSREATEVDAIPEVVSQRMVKRMLVFSGIPTGLAVLIFVGSYIVLIRQIWAVPTTLVLLSTLGCFGLGVLGLSYGALSASWEEAQPGSRLGWTEFQVNFRRMASAWRKPKQDE